MNAETKNPPQGKSTGSKADPALAGLGTVTPHLVCAGASDAIEFYKKAFGATEDFRLDAPDGKIMHARVTIGDSAVMLVDEMPDCGCMGAKALGGSPVTLHLQVADADALFERAVAAGATVTMPLADMFWGDRYGIVSDPYGHNWSIATHIKDLSPEEIQEAAKNACCGQ